MWHPPMEPPLHSKISVGRPYHTYIDQLVDDSGCYLENVPMAMPDRDGWKEWVRRILSLMMIKTGMWGFSSSFQDMAAIPYFGPNPTLVKVKKHSRRSQVFSGTIEWANHFPAPFAKDRIYKFHLRSGVNLWPNRYLKHRASL